MQSARRMAVILALTLIFGLLPSLGASDDAVVTKGYIDKVFIPSLVDYASSLYSEKDASISSLTESVLAGAQNAVAGVSVDKLALLTLNEVKSRQVLFAGRGTIITLEKGETLTAGQGFTASLISGVSNTTASSIDLTTGADVAAGKTAEAGHTLCFADGGGLSAVTATKIEVFGYYKKAPAPLSKYSDLADALSRMGLLAGTGSGFELERGATRIETLVMLIKLLGENEAALAFTGTHPFKDVPSWASAYVAYAYNKKYTSGTAADAFSPNNLATADQYATFILKALGYDSDKDFVWSSAMEFAVQSSVFTSGEKALTAGLFLRDKMAYMSYYALFAGYKSSSVTLMSRLVSDGAMTRSQADEAMASVVRTRPQ